MIAPRRVSRRLLTRPMGGTARTELGLPVPCSLFFTPSHIAVPLPLNVPIP